MLSYVQYTTPTKYFQFNFNKKNKVHKYNTINTTY